MRFQEGKQSSNSRDEFLRLFSTQAFKERHQDSHSHPSTASWTHLLLWRQPSSICFLYMRHEKHYTKQPLFPLAQTNLRVNSEDFWGLSLFLCSKEREKIVTVEWNRCFYPKKGCISGLSFAIWCVSFLHSAGRQFVVSMQADNLGIVHTQYLD